MNMISGSVGSARGEGSKGDRGHGEQEGAGEGEEIPDAIWEDLVSDREDEDGVAGLFGDFSEDEAAQGAAPESAAPDPRPQQEAEEIPEEVPPPPNIPLPICPSQEDWDEHFRTHINYRAWCPVCVEARGRENPHFRQNPSDRTGVPKFCIDYKQTRKSETPIAIMRDNKSHSIGIHKALCKGSADRWTVKRLLRDIENTGHVRIALKGDGEPAMKDLLHSMKAMREQPTIIEVPPGNDPQANGLAEKAVQDGLAQVRTLKLGLEYRVKARIPEAHPVFEWMCEHAGWLINHLRVGRDGLTAWQRVTGRACKQAIVEFGELVYAKPLRISAGNRERANLEPRWYRGVWVGVHDRTGEHVVVALNGGPATLVRTIKRLTEAERWDYEAVDGVLARPRKPDPRGRADSRQAREQPQPPSGAQEGLAPGSAGLQPGRVMPSEPPSRRDFRITKRMIDDEGQTEGCQGCRAAARGGRGNHTAECRRRFEEMLSKTEAGRRRLGGRDVRHGLAEEENRDVDQSQQAGNGQGERGEADEGQKEEGQDRGVDESNTRRRPADAEASEAPSSSRRRMEPRQGVRREREQDGDADSEGEDARPSRYRRVDGIEKSIADVVSIRTDFARERGLESQSKCSRDIAKEMIRALDAKHARKLKAFEDTEKNNIDQRAPRTRGIAEAYSPPRMTVMAREFGLKPQ